MLSTLIGGAIVGLIALRYLWISVGVLRERKRQELEYSKTRTEAHENNVKARRIVGDLDDDGGSYSDRIRRLRSHPANGSQL